MSWFSRFRNALRSQNLDRDLNEEMSDHLERRSETLHAQGLAPEEARRKALLRFGNVTQLHEQSREARLSTAVETTVQDVRYAWRGLLKSPGFSVTAIISLALAIGANTAIYSIVDAAILRPLPVPEPDRLVTLASPTIEAAGSDAHGENESFSYPLYLQFREAAGKSAQLALFSYAGPREVQIPDTNAPIEKAVMQFASGEAFETLRIPPALGQPFTRELDRIPGGHPVVMISHDYWMRRFAGDTHVIGQRLEIEGKHYSVMGVARKGFFGIEPGKFVDVWLPAMMYNKPAFTTPGWGWFRIVGRLSPGSTPVQLQARLQPAFRLHEEAIITKFPTMPPAIQQQFRQADLRAHSGAGGASQFRETFARPLWIVLGVAAGILLTACANVASLLLARSSARAGEMAMRISLGAGRLRLVRQLLTESLLLSVLAGALGWELARLAAPVLVHLLSTDTSPVRFALAMDTRVLLFCTAVSTAAALLFGLLPAWQASGARPMRDLRVAQSTAGRMGMGRFFVGIQVAFAFCLVVAGSGFLFSLKNLFDVKKGFDPHNVAVFRISTSGLSDMTQKAQLNVFLDDVQRRLEALPGVQAAATAQWTLFDGTHVGLQVIVPGKPLPEQEEIIYSVSPRYFSTMRIPLISGRDFEQRDRSYTAAGTPRPTIINQAFAQRYFGSENPVGKIFQTPDEKALQPHEIIGVVADSSFESVRKGPEPMAYSAVRGTNYFTVYVRSGLDLGTLTRMVENETTAMIKGTRVRGVTTLDTMIGDTLLREKLLAGIGGTFAFLALLLAGIGLFGLLNYSVVRRTREIGIRSALGARPLSLVVLVLKEALTLVMGGVVAGLAGSFVLLSAVRSMLFGLGPADPLTISTAVAVFLLATLIAGGAPAGRAVVIDPVTALRHE
jgi:predicted permease